jgi:hypothetical protein
MIDIAYDERNNEITIHPSSVKAAQWVAKYMTTNVAPLHCEKTYGLEVLAAMKRDGLKVSKKTGG